MYRTSTTNSSSIASVAYSPDQRTLDVQFLNGAVYRYFEVPAVAYNEILTAPSKGRYFHRSIRGVYTYQRISPG